jgi:VanZ family protein
MRGRMTFNRNFAEYWLPVILWMGFIFSMSSEAFSERNASSWDEAILRFLAPEISSQKVGLINKVIRKPGHVIEYFILGLLLFRAFRGDSTGKWNWRWPSLAVIVVIFFAAGDEFHQSLVPTRTASVVDVGIDTAGAVVAQFISPWWYWYKKK